MNTETHVETVASESVTVEVAEAPQVAEVQPVEDTRTVLRLDVDQVIVVKNNRTHFDEGYIAELAESIKANGLRMPIEVNYVNGRYELIAGDSRLRAHKLAGIKTIRAFVNEGASDAEAYAIKLTENITRAALRPMEEANGIGEMVYTYGAPVSTVARRFGKSEQWVQDRLTLRTLPEKVKDLLNERRVSIGACLALAAVLPKAGKKLPDAYKALIATFLQNPPSAGEAERWMGNYLWHHAKSIEGQASESAIRSYGLYNSSVWERAFPTDKEVAGHGPCSDCGHRQMLKAHGHGKETLCCMMTSCYNYKQAAALEPLKVEHKEKEAAKQAREEAKFRESLCQKVQAERPELEGEEVAKLAMVALDLHQKAVRAEAWTYKEEDKVERQQALAEAVEAAGFASVGEFTAALNRGAAITAKPGTIPVLEFVGRVAVQLRRKAEGADIAAPYTPPAPPAGSAKGGATQEAMQTSPALEGADPATADALRAQGAAHWTFKSGSEPVVVESYLPVSDLMEHFAQRTALGASSMSKGFGSVKVYVPELDVVYDGNDDNGGALTVEENGLTMRLRSLTMRFSVPTGPAYFCEVLPGKGAQKDIRTLTVIPVERNGEPVHIILDGSGYCQLRKDLIPKFKKLMNALPGMPTAAPAEETQAA